MQVRCHTIGRPAGLIDTVWCESIKSRMKFAGLTYAELRTRMGKVLAEATIMKKLNGRIGVSAPERAVITRIVEVALREAADKAGLL